MEIGVFGRLDETSAASKELSHSNAVVEMFRLAPGSNHGRTSCVVDSSPAPPGKKAPIRIGRGTLFNARPLVLLAGLKQRAQAC
eukprot:scaffold1883_cov261-Pinguiococcus_pyrenoidosus.AAC.22